MEERLTARNVTDAVPALLALVSQEHAAGRLSDGEFHNFQGHVRRHARDAGTRQPGSKTSFTSV
jgi:hypothetical protein